MFTRIDNDPTLPNRDRSMEVYISDQLCGTFPDSLASGTWYTVTCSTPLVGTEVEFRKTLNEYHNWREA